MAPRSSLPLGTREWLLRCESAGNWDGADLHHDADEIELPPVLGDLALDDATHVNAGDRDGLASG